MTREVEKQKEEVKLALCVIRTKNGTQRSEVHQGAQVVRCIALIMSPQSTCAGHVCSQGFEEDYTKKNKCKDAHEEGQKGQAHSSANAMQLGIAQYKEEGHSDHQRQQRC